MDKLRVGVIGLGSIFHRVMKGFDKAENCELYAVAARDLDRARSEAQKYGAKKAFGSYEELATCPEVDLVYIATPHNLHHDNAIMCMNHGKHVLCEKAFAMNGNEAREMVECARKNGVFLMEAMWTRFLPMMQKLKNMLDAGELGKIRNISADFSYSMPFMPESRIYAPELGGGALMDVGIYPLSICAMLLGDKPKEIQSMCVKAPSGVDARTVIQMMYEGGATAQLMGGVDAKSSSRMAIATDTHFIELPVFWCGTKMIIDGNAIEFPMENEGHHHQFEHIYRCIRDGKLESDVMPLDETIRLMDIMTTIRTNHGLFYAGETNDK